VTPTVPPDPQRPDAVPPSAAGEAITVHDSRCDVWAGRACTCDGRQLLGRPVSPPAGSWTLWWRPHSKTRWTVVGNAATEVTCDDMIGTGGRRHGQWYSAPAGRDPNHDGRRPR
jgi:hypothetical protein